MIDSWILFPENTNRVVSTLTHELLFDGSSPSGTSYVEKGMFVKMVADINFHPTENIGFYPIEIFDDGSIVVTLFYK